MELPEWVWQVLRFGLTAVFVFTLNAIAKRQDRRLFDQRNENPAEQVYRVSPLTKYLGIFLLLMGFLGLYLQSSPERIWIYTVMFFGISLLGLWLFGLSVVARVTITQHEVTSYGILDNRSMQLKGLIKENKKFFSESIVLENNRGEKVTIPESIANREYLISVIHARSAANTRASTHPLSANQQKIAKRSH
ncbi:hypothetical protein [Phaeocystidibacter luteus]|uniref:Uncharacterized protein n=1 Tax=Phaeocystidibacter luteus TaxID=911197 RepID=A0A6N6RL40_9FLAO|nr:hypothetical protein [Phaeocystidibacter luteus]KAB2810332.1 hypothetical protein F8C67_07025 [Phaeocystidibacter luteus]